MTDKERFLPNQKRVQPISLPQEFTDEEMVRDWTLSATDKAEINKTRTVFRVFLLFNSVQYVCIGAF